MILLLSETELWNYFVLIFAIFSSFIFLTLWVLHLRRITKSHRRSEKSKALPLPPELFLYFNDPSPNSPILKPTLFLFNPSRYNSISIRVCFDFVILQNKLSKIDNFFRSLPQFRDEFQRIFRFLSVAKFLLELQHNYFRRKPESSRFVSQIVGATRIIFSRFVLPTRERRRIELGRIR